MKIGLNPKSDSNKSLKNNKPFISIYVLSENTFN